MQPQDSFEVLSINDTSYILTKFFTGEEPVTEEIDSVIYYKIVSIDSVGQTNGKTTRLFFPKNTALFKHHRGIYFQIFIPNSN